MLCHLNLITMQITTKQFLTFLLVLAWIIFLGLCVVAGGIVFNTIFWLVKDGNGHLNFWEGADFTSLYHYDKGHFMVQTLLMSIVAILKALMFYFIVRLAYNKKVSLSQPFNRNTQLFIFRVSYLTLLIGLFSNGGSNYGKWLAEKGIAMPDVQQLYFNGADIWLFMSVTLFVIGHLFKRGIDIQSENELTV